MSSVQMVTIVIGVAALLNLAIVLVVQALGLHRGQAGAGDLRDERLSEGVGPFPPDDAKPLSPEEMSEIFSHYRIAGGYKPTPIKKADEA